MTILLCIGKFSCRGDVAQIKGINGLHPQSYTEKFLSSILMLLVITSFVTVANPTPMKEKKTKQNNKVNMSFTQRPKKSIEESQVVVQWGWDD